MIPPNDRSHVHDTAPAGSVCRAKCGVSLRHSLTRCYELARSDRQREDTLSGLLRQRVVFQLLAYIHEGTERDLSRGAAWESIRSQAFYGSRKPRVRRFCRGITSGASRTVFTTAPRLNRFTTSTRTGGCTGERRPAPKWRR